jgi:hypothetical protein
MNRSLLIMLVATSVEASADQRRDIEKAVATVPAARLRKIDLRPTIKSIFPSLTTCYDREVARDPKIRGVVNTQLLIRNDPKLGLSLTVEGFDTDGTLGNSQPFLACAKRVFESKVFAPIAMRGSLHVSVPGTFTTEPVDNHDLSLVESAHRALEAKRWAQALADATQGLKQTFLDGPPRRHLIEIGGVAACELRDEKAARRYFRLASAKFEDRIAKTCAAAGIDLDN